MKHKTIILFIICIPLVILGPGCRKALDINHNPDNPSLEVGTPKLVLPVGQMAAAGVAGGQLAIVGSIYGEYLTQAAGGSQYKEISQYDLRAPDIDKFRIYRPLYTSGLKNLQFVIDKSRHSQDWPVFLMGTVMKAYTASLLADLFDQIPYTEALQGSANIYPHFDEGYLVYKSLLSEIDTALSKNLSADNTIGKSDLVFGGKVEDWIKFANTLELKLYLRMVNAKPAEAEAGIKALYARGASFLDVDAGITNFMDEASKSNPMYEQNIRQLNNANNLVASSTYALFLKSNNDPRMVTFFGSMSANSLDQGDYLNTSQAALSAAVFREKPVDPVMFISEAESYFLQAEARVRYFNAADAKTYYDKGVLAAFASVGQDGSAFIAPGGNYEFPGGAPADMIKAIIVQKWASFPYGNHFIEGWFEKNRTGYPETSSVYSTSPVYIPGQFVIAKNSILPPGKMPLRLVFPDSERATNPNTPAEVPSTVPVWWAIQ